jgi:predicted AlkP superfamily pyrophosphatase or phosphodiesterase
LVVLSIDQMRQDYLTRFADLYTGGFATLLRDGASFTNANHTHALTGTAPGHATLVTGVYPARHGIPSNLFWDRTERRRRYAVEDLSVETVGVPSDTGRSPANLRQTAIGDWMKRDAPSSKVFSIAQKDRVAVLMGGKQPDGVYWYHTDVGQMVTSTYYRDALPTWVEEFNASDPWRTYFDPGWTKLLDDTAYTRAREDSFPPENYGWANAFPHPISVPDSVGSPYHLVTLSPFADAVMLAFAEAIVVHEELGSDDAPDLLLVGLSSADLLGHDFGPFSQELEDYFLRIDGFIGGFIEFLDARIGRNNYVLALTSDHGAPMMAEEAQRRGIKGERVSSQDLQQAFVPELQQALFDLKIDVLPRLSFVFPFGLTVAFPDGVVSEDTNREVRKRMATSLASAPWADDAFSYEDLADTTVQRPFIDAYRRSFVPDRAPDVMVHFRENYYYAPQLMVDHGTPYAYDTHVPLIFLGGRIHSAEIGELVLTVDLAPTLAVLADIAFPADLDGAVLESVVP